MFESIRIQNIGQYQNVLQLGAHAGVNRLIKFGENRLVTV